MKWAITRFSIDLASEHVQRRLLFSWWPMCLMRHAHSYELGVAFSSFFSRVYFGVGFIEIQSTV